MADLIEYVYVDFCPEQTKQNEQNNSIMFV